ncbi:hypothetical protein BLNAU_21663 [Blattamonas nauphoetae]|uniref:Uncharacterized protein n=1 Tax=Blattamonas nauphoetae TaxID=2049346 RepID=A0ABQ9WYC2_9EUKA|nr:hypothetical protein BLNAU_21663 [Blattamonas nauphoetae]
MNGDGDTESLSDSNASPHHCRKESESYRRTEVTETTVTTRKWQEGKFSASRRKARELFVCRSTLVRLSGAADGRLDVVGADPSGCALKVTEKL